MNQLARKKSNSIFMIVSFLSLLLAGAWAASYKPSSLAAVDDTLPDGTKLSFIFADFTGISINDKGDVAFLGTLKEDFSEAVLSQKGLIVKVGDSLRDGTVLSVIAPSGQGVSINGAGKVAFFGRRASDLARGVFTQDGLIAAAGDRLPDGTFLSFLPSESLSINDRGRVAYLGVTNTTTSRPAVFTQDGLVAAAGDTLTDGTKLDTIFTDFSSVAMNNAGMVAFMGRRDSDLARGVFTQDGLIAAAGDTLGDGTLVGRIFTLRTGISINDRNQVAFFGLLGGSLGPPAVFTQDGLVAAVGDTLPDGTMLSRIFLESVSINNEGQVAFMGVIGQPPGRAAIFTQDGLVAAVGDRLPVGSILTHIYRDSISINNAGQIAFFGQTDRGVSVFRVDTGNR